MPKFQLSSRLTIVSFVFLSLLVSVTASNWRVSNAQTGSGSESEFTTPSAPEARALTLGTSAAMQGGTATVPVTLTATGVEFGLSFTANWDPSLLSISGVWGADVLPGATALPSNCMMAINHYSVEQGRLGVYIGCPNGGIPVGTDEILNLRFRAKDAAVAGMQVPIYFGNTPLNTEIGDSNGETIAVNKVPGAVTIVAPLTGTKSMVTISGRVTTQEGNGLRNAIVILIYPDGVVRTATTSSFGFYQFDNVESDTTYIITVASRSYRFGTRMVTVADSIADMDLVGLE